MAKTSFLQSKKSAIDKNFKMVNSKNSDLHIEKNFSFDLFSITGVLIDI